MTTPLEKAVNVIVRIASPDRIILFGSHATGKEGPESDYDILVLKKDLKNQRKLVQEIYLNFRNIGAPIDVLVIDTKKYEKLRFDPYMIYSEADKNGKVIYDKP